MFRRSGRWFAGKNMRNMTRFLRNQDAFRLDALVSTLVGGPLFGSPG
jgi:hypothetical protein